jgi:anti-sigma regulatory factor (Ser/Thr protein kinase)
MVTCVSEAATNVVKYGPPGRLEVRVDEAAVRLRLDDVGPGIEFANLPRAVLMPGFSTAPSLGLGYSILLELCDRVHLATGEKGTSLVLEAARQAPDPLDAFIGLSGGIPAF